MEVTEISSGMGEGQQDDQADRGQRGSFRVLEEVRGTVTCFGESISYSYHLVHTQESVRVYNLRLNPVSSYGYAILRILFGARGGYNPFYE